MDELLADISVSNTATAFAPVQGEGDVPIPTDQVNDITSDPEAMQQFGNALAFAIFMNQIIFESMGTGTTPRELIDDAIDIYEQNS